MNGTGSGDARWMGVGSSQTDAGAAGREAAAEAVAGRTPKLRRVACLEELADEHENRFLLMLPDGLAGDQQEIVRGAYSVVGAAVPLVGGCAGDDGHMRGTLQMHGMEGDEESVLEAADAGRSS